MTRLRFVYLRHSSRFWWGLAILVGLCLTAWEAAARPGGGGNYTGGGGSDGIGGGGDGGGDGFGFLLYLVFAYPEVGVPALVVVAIFTAVQKIRNGDGTTARAVRRLEQPIHPPQTDLGTICSRDLHFRPDNFLVTVEKLVFTLQDAWCRGNMDPVRPHLSDGLMRRFETQLAIYKRQGVQNAMADHRVLKTSIHDAEHDAHFDTIHVYLRASARDVEVDASLSFDQALAKAKKAPLVEYAEIWSFLRSPGAKTPPDAVGVEGRCPNCGVELTLGQTTKCSHCSVLINSGEYNWVLAEITQPEEWRRVSKASIPGLTQLTQSDPRFNRQAAEDRASYLFWRWIEAKVLAVETPLSKVATSAFRSQMAEYIKSGPAALFKVAVGGADLIACEPSTRDRDDGRDRIHVKILWSSARSNQGISAHQTHVITMSRKSGVTSSGTLSHARCPECHGPLMENDTPTCDYCGANLTDGASEWVLELLRFPEEVKLRSPSQDGESGLNHEKPWVAMDMGSAQERTLLLMRMAAVVQADGQVTEEERKLLKKMSKRWQVPLEAVQPILAGEMSSELAMTLKPRDPRAFLDGLVQAALVDGRVDKREAKLLVDIGRNLGFNENEIRAMW